MKRTAVKLDQQTLSLLASIAEAKDDPRVIAELADLDPNEFREFVKSSENIHEDANQLIEAAEPSADEPITSTEAIAHYHVESGGNILTGFTDPGVFVDRIAPFSLVFTLYFGMMVSLTYGFLGAAIVLYFGTKSAAQQFWIVYTSSFKT